MEILHKYFPGITPGQREQYRVLHEQVLYWNQRMNLISRKDSGQLAERHILHSLGISLHAGFERGDIVLDVGTGGGFPGLPLAIMHPETHFILLDSIGKKIRAVADMAEAIGIGNVEPQQNRAEEFKGSVHHIVSRAVTSLDRFTGWVRGILRHPERENTGLWYLKGGELEAELRPFPEARVFDLKDDFDEPFFETKKLVWLPPKILI